MRTPIKPPGINNLGKTIDLFKTPHGWFALFSDFEERYGANQAIPTVFTRHARAIDVERAIASKNPDHTIFVISS